MKKNGWNGAPIDIIEMPDGIYTTIDNTRVVSARQAGINVEANIHSYNEALPSEFIERFTTKKGVPRIWYRAPENIEYIFIDDCATALQRINDIIVEYKRKTHTF